MFDFTNAPMIVTTKEVAIVARAVVAPICVSAVLFTTTNSFSAFINICINTHEHNTISLIIIALLWIFPLINHGNPKIPLLSICARFPQPITCSIGRIYRIVGNFNLAGIN